MILSPVAVQKFFDNNGAPLVAGLLFTYASGTSTKLATYKNASGSQSNTNPIVLDFRGECEIWIDPTLSYKFILAPATDTDPPTNPIWSQDDISPGEILAFGNYSVDTGVANAYVAASAIPIAAYSAGLLVSVKIANDNTGASTLSYAGLAPKDITLQNGADLYGGELLAGGIYQFEYDGTNFQLLDPAVAFWETPQESAALITTIDFSKQPTPIIDITRHGFKLNNTETQNATAVSEASSVLQEYTTLGGEIQLPPGEFNCDPILIPQRITVKGTGQQATWLVNGDNVPFITLGSLANTGVLKYGCGLTDVSVYCNHRNGSAIYLRETAGATLKNIYSENNGRTGNTDTGKCVQIDGGDVSSFFNILELVIANHWNTCYKFFSSGSVFPTCSFFFGCTALADVSIDNSGSGLEIAAAGGTAQGSVWFGGNIEQCARGVLHGAGSAGITVQSARFESNTNDVVFGLQCNPQNYIACSAILNIQDNSGTGFERHVFRDCTKPDGSRFTGDIPGPNVYRSSVSGEIPMTVQAYPAATTDRLLKLISSGGTELFGVDSTGLIQKQLYRSGAVTPVGAVTPLFIGEDYLETTTPRWYKATGAGNTNWVALN